MFYVSTSDLRERQEHNNSFQNTEAVVQRRSVKNVFLEVPQNSQENTCTKSLFWLLFFEISKKNFFTDPSAL